MHRVLKLFKANVIVFISSFCIMVIELIAARMMAPYIGVSLYTWTSIISVILTGIALGNYLGGKIADKYPSTLSLVFIFFVGGMLTIAILPLTKLVTNANWFETLPVMLNFMARISCLFFLPAIILSMVSPVIIKLSLVDLERAGGTVGVIYAFSTAGAILGTFMTGFYLIHWFGTRTIVWLVAATLILTGILIAIFWRITSRRRFFTSKIAIWLGALLLILWGTGFLLFQRLWQESFTSESNYYTIKVTDGTDNTKVLTLDRATNSNVKPDEPTYLEFDYLKVMAELLAYTNSENPALTVLHLGAGGYTMPRYIETVYPGSTNDVVEIDPSVTRVAYQELGLSPETSINTYNQDARLFLLQQKIKNQYDVVVGDVFDDYATPYHLTTSEFAKLIETCMKADGIYLVNIIDDCEQGRYMPSFVYTLRQVFNYVYLFSPCENWRGLGMSNFVVAATNRPIDVTGYKRFISAGRTNSMASLYWEEIELNKLFTERNPILLKDDYAPTDILLAPFISGR
jgi:spermidine synthase